MYATKENLICPYKKLDDCFGRCRSQKNECYVLSDVCVGKDGKPKPICPFYKSKKEVDELHNRETKEGHPLFHWD